MGHEKHNAYQLSLAMRLPSRNRSNVRLGICAIREMGCLNLSGQVKLSQVISEGPAQLNGLTLNNKKLVAEPV